MSWIGALHLASVSIILSIKLIRALD
jgi:hypothetical protein